MKKTIAFLLLLCCVAAAASAKTRKASADLIGVEEVPAISTSAGGTFNATISSDETSFTYTLSYHDLRGAATQSHIHFGEKSVNGGIVVFFCSNLGNGPAGTQACPAAPATITGTIKPADVIGPAGQGIGPGEFDELMDALQAGVTYVNVHSAKYPGGEIRAQIDADRRHDGD
jgi:hypothetical protein